MVSVFVGLKVCGMVEECSKEVGEVESIEGCAGKDVLYSLSLARILPIFIVKAHHVISVMANM